MTVTITDNFGLVAVYNAVPSTNDWACTYWNWIFADTILYAAAVSHKHDGATALQNPTGTLSLSTAATGGYLPAATTYYIAVTYIDTLNRETAASDVAEVTTGAGIATPATPTINDDATPTDIQPHVSGLTGGDYWYKIAYTLGGGESLCSSPVYVSIPTDTTYECTIHFESIDSVGNGADGIYVYRKTGTTGSYVLLADLTDTSLTSYTDDNSGVPTCDKAPLTVSTIASFNTITINWASLDYVNAETVKIYGTTTEGTYPASSLIASVDMNDATPVEEYEWDGTARTSGKPPEVSNCYPSPSKIALATEVSGNLPWANLPSDFSWEEPVANFAALSTGIAGEARVVLDEDAIYIWDADLATPAWIKVSGVKVVSYPDSPGTIDDGEVYAYQFQENGLYYLYVGQPSPFSDAQVLLASDADDTVGYYAEWDTPGELDWTPNYGYGSIAFVWDDKSFYYWNDEIATPAWIKGPGVVKTGETVTDVEEDATPTNEQLKINEILEVLRTSGLIET